VSAALLAGLLSAGVGGFLIGWFARRHGEESRRRADEACANESIRAAGKARERAMSQARDAEIRFRQIRKEHGPCSENLGQWVRACAGLREMLVPDADAPAVVFADALLHDNQLELSTIRGAVDSVERPEVEIASRASQPVVLLREPAGSKDDLQSIRGIGPALESKLNDLGIFHFHQIARLGDEGVDWLAARLEAVPERVRRDGWVEQAKLLDPGGPPKPPGIRHVVPSSASGEFPSHHPRLAGPDS